MNNEKFDLSQIQRNLASKTTTFSGASYDMLEFEQYEVHVVGIISSLCESQATRYVLIKSINRLKNIFALDVPLTLRTQLFVHINTLIGSLMPSYYQDQKVYFACFEMVTAFKTHVDQTPQLAEDLAELEWQELSKSVYLLTDWEDMLGASLVQAAAS